MFMLLTVPINTINNRLYELMIKTELIILSVVNELNNYYIWKRRIVCAAKQYIEQKW